MAITFIQQPYFISPTGNPINFVASGDSHLANFKYKIEVIDTPTSQVLYSEFKLPYPINGFGWINMQRILEPFTNYDLNGLVNKTLNWQTANVYRQYNVRVTEFIGSASADVETSNNLYAYNGAYNVKEWEALHYQSLIIPATGTTGKFLTDRRNIKVRLGESYEVGVISGIGIGTTNAAFLRIEYFDASGSLITQSAIPNTDVSAPSAHFKRILVGAGDIPMTIPQYSSYRISVENDANERVSHYINFELDTSCVRGEVARVHYLNRYGRFDSFTFTRPYSQNTRVDAKEYSRIRGAMGNSGYTYTNQEAGIVQYNTKFDDLYTFRADYLTNEESAALFEMVQSPAIFWEVSSGVLIPLILDTREFEKKYISKDKLFDAEMVFRVAYNQFRQQL
jgi:hypothetical protein